MTPIKSSHGIAILGTCFLLSLFFVNWSSKQIESIALYIPAGSQTAQVVSSLPDGLVAHYTFDDTANDSAGSNNGTVSGGATYVDGKVGKAMQFDGVDDYVNSGSAVILDNLGQFSISVWSNAKSYGESGLGFFLSKSDSTGSSGWLFRERYTQAVEFNVDYTTTDLYVPSAGGVYPVTDFNKWINWVVTWDGSTSASNVHIYKNGVEISYGLTTNAVGTRADESSRSLAIGNGSSLGARTFDGSLDDVRIYNRVLTPGEVTELYNYSGSGVTTSSATTNVIEVTPAAQVQVTQQQASDTTLNTTQNGVCASNTYYIDYENGNDINDGKCTGGAWKHSPWDPNSSGLSASLVKTFVAGTTIKFKGGVVYRGVVVNGSEVRGATDKPIVFSGDSWPGLEGVKSVIDGSLPVTGWIKCESQSVCGNNPNWQKIYYSFVSIPSFLGTTPAIALNVYQNNQPLTDAQYPTAINARYPVSTNFLHPQMVTATTLTDSRLAQFGSEIVGKYIYLWVLPNVVTIRKVLSYDSSTNTISFASATVYADGTTVYAIVNSFNILAFDIPGQYYLNEVSETSGLNKLYIWPLNNQDLSAGGEITISNQSRAFHFSSPSDLTISGFKIKQLTGDSYGEGTAIMGSGSSAGSNIIVENNEISEIGKGEAALISLFNVSNLLIQNNYLHDTGQGLRGIQAGGITPTFPGRNIQIKNNTIQNIGGTGIYCPTCSMSTITGNTIRDGRGTHANGISVYQKSDHVTISNNTVVNSNIALTIENSSTLNIINNIFDGSGSTNYTVASWGGMTGVNNFMNNIVLGSTSHCSVNFVDTVAASYIFKNNIIDGGGSVTATMNSGYNIYTNRCWFQKTLGQGEIMQSDLTQLFQDPSIKDYRLKSGSSAIDHGTNLSSYFTTDLSGAPRPQGSAWDIGAYEYTGNVTPPTSIPGDFNSDGRINTTDFSALSSHWNHSDALSIPYDLNKDGIVNSLDYVIMVQGWTG